MNEDKLHELWKNLSLKEKDGDNSLFAGVGQQKSELPINVINRNMKLKLYWHLAFIALALILTLFFLERADLLVIIGLFILETLFSFVLIRKQHKKALHINPLTENTHNMLINYYSCIQSMLRFERLSAWFSIPFSALLGMAFYVVWKYGSLVVLLNNTTMVLAVVGVIIILSPVAIWWTYWSQKKAYQPYLKKIESYIDIFNK
ncbi:MAG: hypothetical protein K9I94_11020 [Bacteroidales bacterium]|nr:hypothetical protein [Bacteroidales bacterium]